MHKIKFDRLVRSGLVAGIVEVALGLLVNGVILWKLWSNDMIYLSRTEFLNTEWFEFSILWLILGFLSIWIYVALRSLLGAGWKTAVYAGLTVWVIGVLLPNANFMTVMGLFSKHLTLYTTVGGLVQVVAGTVAGAWLYKDK